MKLSESLGDSIEHMSNETIHALAKDVKNNSKFITNLGEEEASKVKQIIIKDAERRNIEIDI